MSELELNQMHDWEDKCNEATMNQSEADKIIEYIKDVTYNAPHIERKLITYINSLVVVDEPDKSFSEYAYQLEQKLKDIECGDCGKNMLECECDDQDYVQGVGVKAKEKETLYCSQCGFSTMPSSWCGECYSYSGVTKDKLPETDTEIALRKWKEYYEHTIKTKGVMAFSDWLKEQEND